MVSNATVVGQLVARFADVSSNDSQPLELSNGVVANKGLLSLEGFLDDAWAAWHYIKQTHSEIPPGHWTVD